MHGTLLLVIQLAALTTEPIVVASPSAQVQSLSRKEVRHIFTLRRKSWSNGIPVRIVLPPVGSSEDKWLSEELLGLPPDVYRRFLAEQAYRRGGKMPLRADKAGVIKTVKAAGSSAGVVSVVPSPAEPPLVPVKIQSK